MVYPEDNVTASNNAQHLLLSLYALNTRLMSLFWKSWVCRMANASPNFRGSLRLLSTSSSCSRRLCVRDVDSTAWRCKEVRGGERTDKEQGDDDVELYFL